MVGCLLLDTGLRISEALGLRKMDLDFDKLVLRVYGKGSKERLVPTSLELRRMLFRWHQRQSADLVFGTRNGTKPTVRNFSTRLQRALQKGIDNGRPMFAPHLSALVRL